MATITVPAQADKLVGKAIRRREDPRLLTGTATYVDDIRMPGMYHACIVRSPHAAAHIQGINTKPALDLPGVVAVYTGSDIKDVGPVPCGASLPGLRVPDHRILAQDRVYGPLSISFRSRPPPNMDRRLANPNTCRTGNRLRLPRSDFQAQRRKHQEHRSRRGLSRSRRRAASVDAPFADGRRS